MKWILSRSTEEVIITVADAATLFKGMHLKCAKFTDHLYFVTAKY